MRTVKNINELKQNFKTLDGYLKLKKDPEYAYGLDLVKKGICFIALNEDGAYRFYPSRFIGYSSNSMDAHMNNEYRDGWDTNPAISVVLEKKPVHNPTLEKKYREYCESLGIVASLKGAFGVERKYWEM